ncbi:MAG: aryl-sulfate sulfotransferase, partial [Halobacteriales archaeon]|nr:aryl-sulfate sulfotransferase [Halobacteriales archaeon]
SDRITHDPTGYAALSAVIELETSEPVGLVLRVAGRHGPDSDVVRSFPELSETHRIPVLGLYQDHDNLVELTLLGAGGKELTTLSYAVATGPANPHLPEITIDQAQAASMVSGMTLVSYYGHDGQNFPNRPFIFDRYGDVRWVLDYDGHPSLGDLSFDDGIERLANGNLYFGSQRTNRIYEVDMTGEVVNSWDMPGFGFHHQVLEMPNGNFLVTVHNLSLTTIEDHVIEIDRTSGAIVQVWNLTESLDPSRRTWSDRVDDWAHLNAIVYDEEDDSIIVSARHQGVIELTRDNEVAWILAPHRGWGTAGDGTDLSTRLLQPLDAAGLSIDDVDVLSGEANHPDFEWNWYQHAPLLMPDGNILLFDNGDNRNYRGEGPYSRAVEYDIDETAMTVRQEWSYGKERGGETYSRIVSDVDYAAGTDHVFFSPGAVDFGGTSYGKVVEIERASRAVVFEATITPPEPFFIVTFHRTERLSLYPD